LQRKFSSHSDLPTGWLGLWDPVRPIASVSGPQHAVERVVDGNDRFADI
jgi:hypothetical protein